MVAPERQFDFWIGVWEVFDPAGHHVGRSRIELTTGGRVIRESWTGDRGLVGTSMNFFDAAGGRWHQVWVDAQGAVLRFEGDFVDGALRYTGETPLPDGGRQQERLTFTPLDGGRVHQFWEQSQDGGDTWTVAFDGTYVPRAADTPAAPAGSTEDVVRRNIAAYVAGDRATAERLIAPTFVFTSPQDDHIDRAAFFERCFPTADRFASQELKRVVGTGDDVFVTYEYELRETGERYRNAKLLTVKDGQIVEAQVFFGGRVG